MYILKLVLLGLICSISANEKRLLVTDPDVLAQRIHQLEISLQHLEETTKQQATLIEQLTYRLHTRENSAGSSFVRWGVKTCTNTTELVYSGYMGGGSYDKPGSAANHVCLVHETVLGRHKPNSYAWMNGAEYEAYFDGIAQDDAPCSVCLNKNAHTTIMIPGTNVCYSGWSHEYDGVLVSGQEDHKAASTFVCLDKNREILDGGAADLNGRLLYTVVGKCGSLKCPPYKDDYEITCVVCSK